VRRCAADRRGLTPLFWTLVVPDADRAGPVGGMADGGRARRVKASRDPALTPGFPCQPGGLDLKGP
jgi:hypothetical protein